MGELAQSESHYTNRLDTKNITIPCTQLPVAFIDILNYICYLKPTVTLNKISTHN